MSIGQQTNWRIFLKNSIEALPVARDSTPLLPGQSAVSGKSVETCFDGSSLSSDVGVLAMREIDIRL